MPVEPVSEQHAAPQSASGVPLAVDELAEWRAFLAWSEHVTSVLGRALATHGMSVADFQVLARLGGADGLDQGELQADLGWSPSRLSHQLKRMETRGLVTGAAVRPGQVRRVALTPDGRRLLTDALGSHGDAVRAVFVEPTTPTLRAELRRLGEAL